MREQIAEIIAESIGTGFAPGTDARIAADAILAAMPDLLAGMVKPLEWEQLSPRAYRCMITEKLSWRCEAYADGRWFTTYSVPGYCDTLIQGEWESFDLAKCAVQAHHAASILSALTIPTQPEGAPQPAPAVEDT